MRKEKQQGARYNDTTSCGYILEEEDEKLGILKDIESHYVSFDQIK